MELTNEAADLIDRAAIREVLDLYHAAINFRDWSLLPRIFLPDAVWHAKPPLNLRYEGIEAIERGFRTNVDRQNMLIQASAGLDILLDGTGVASARSTLIELGREGENPLWSAIVTFEDTLVRGPQGWRLSLRIADLRHLLNFAPV